MRGSRAAANRRVCGVSLNADAKLRSLRNVKSEVSRGSARAPDFPCKRVSGVNVNISLHFKGAADAVILEHLL